MELQKNKAVAIWLLIGAAMIIIQVLLGGITRLTGSGLSITEWKPILGALPPLNDHDWNLAFEKYKQIAQYKYIHNYFTLQDFKSIYFWEWLHRNWARFMGLVFIIPFVYFIITKRINKTMLWPMVILFILGGLQGAIGWIMVASGVGTDLVYVSHIRLAVHFIAALLLLCYVVWFALKLIVPSDRLAHSPSLHRFNIFLLALLTLQLIYGAFMAGTHAGQAAITWPDINGYAIPAKSMLKEGGFLNDITHNLISIQFIHRGIAYLLTILIILFTIKIYQQPRNTLIYKARLWPLTITLLQVVLGVLAVLNYLTNAKFTLSIFHQLVGMLLLVSLTITLYFSKKRQPIF